MVTKHTIDELKAKIHEMYPKIEKHGVAATVTFDKAKKTYVLELKKGPHHPAPTSTRRTRTSAWTGSNAST